MRIGLSALNEQCYNWSLIQNPACIRCGLNYEDVMHYVLDCPLYAVPRIKLPEEFSSLLQTLGVDIYTNKEVTTNTLLNGSNDLNMNENLHVFKIAEKFIEMINLF